MSLLRRRSTAPARPAVIGWHADGTGIVSAGDNAGGDIQRGDSYSVRFVRDDMPGSLVTITFYAAEHCEDSGGFVVQREVEWMICEDPSDPGGTELWSDVDYTDQPGTDLDDVDRTRLEAFHCATSCLRYGAGDINWDGQPFRTGR